MKTPQTFNLCWLPDPYSFATLAAGRHGWDSLGMPRVWGFQVLDTLGESSGAVIVDDLGRLMYWLVPTGALQGWDPPAGHGINIYGTGSYVTVPGRLRPTAPRWSRPQTVTSCLTDARALRAAVERALGSCLENAQ